MNYKTQPLLQRKLEEQQLIRLNLIVPPMFEEALNYSGDARFVAFFSSHSCKETVLHTDGRITRPGSHPAWQLWLLHRTTASELWSYNFGRYKTPAMHWLLLDRDERDFYVGRAAQIEHFLLSMPGAGAMRASLAWLLVRKHPYARRRIHRPLMTITPDKPVANLRLNADGRCLAMQHWLDH